MKKIICDACENEIKQNEITIEHTFGYGSKRDGDSVRLDLCEDCFDKIIKDIAHGIIQY